MRSAAYEESLKDFWTLRELITRTRSRTTRVAFWDPPSGSKDLDVEKQLKIVSFELSLERCGVKKLASHGTDYQQP